MLTDEDRKEIGKAISEELIKLTNSICDLMDNILNATCDEGILPLSKKVKSIYVDLMYVKAVLKATGLSTDESYNKYIEEFKRLNPNYFNDKEK